jgi:RNA polymerase sigma-70 factor (ECF subfamily)
MNTSARQHTKTKSSCGKSTLPLEEVWESFHRKLTAFLKLRVRDPETAQDLLQEVFIRVHANLGCLRNPEKLESWLYQITRNILIDYYRSPKTGPKMVTPAAMEADFTGQDLNAYFASSLRAMVDTLPEPYRQALILTAFGGISQADLAQKLGLSFSGAKSRVQRGRQMLRDRLYQCCHFELDRYGTILEYYERCCCCGSEPKAS